MGADYGGYRGILAEARSLEASFRQQRLAACPLCGDRLDWRGDVANCPMGHFRAVAPTVADYP